MNTAVRTRVIKLLNRILGHFSAPRIRGNTCPATASKLFSAERTSFSGILGLRVHTRRQIKEVVVTLQITDVQKGMVPNFMVVHEHECRPTHLSAPSWAAAESAPV